MPILLTTAVAGSPRVKIASFHVMLDPVDRPEIHEVSGVDYPCAIPYSGQINVKCEYGDFIGSGIAEDPYKWEPNTLLPELVIPLAGVDYDTAIESEIEAGDNSLLYNGVKRVLYEVLLDKEIFAGTVETTSGVHWGDDAHQAHMKT